MRVGIFLENMNYESIDFSHPEYGNPGIRGTQYMMWIIACKLSEFYDMYMFAPNIKTMPKMLHSYQCMNECEAATYAEKLKIDVFILRANSEKIEVYKKLKNSKMKYIFWSHNFEDYFLANIVSNNQNIKRLVCVGRQQYERLRDHKVFFKATYIYNALDCSNFQIPRQNNEKKIVTYIGALNRLKGFHKVAKVWNKVLKAVPDAQLYVLGSGNMGNANQMGKYGLAEKKYEKKFIKYLLDNNGKIIPSVHFFGNIGGKEKEKIILESTLGIANPTGIGETFCLVATEFEAFGVPVVSKNGFGLLDTVKDGQTGILVNNDIQLVEAIVKLLNNKNENGLLGENGKQFVKDNFDINRIVLEWKNLLEDVYNDVPVHVNLECNYINKQCKWLREINRKVQDRGIPTISILAFESVLPYLLKRIVKILKV